MISPLTLILLWSIKQVQDVNWIHVIGLFLSQKRYWWSCTVLYNTLFFSVLGTKAEI